jgi:hypothetical protein
MTADSLSIRAGTVWNDWLGNIHNVSAGFYHSSYNQSGYNEYDVAILKVCTDFDIPIDISK